MCIGGGQVVSVSMCVFCLYEVNLRCTRKKDVLLSRKKCFMLLEMSIFVDTVSILCYMQNLCNGIFGQSCFEIKPVGNFHLKGTHTNSPSKLSLHSVLS